ncbi:alpha-amylase family glycosyl hydrolase [Cellulosilyticum ruminicola]|uniref:alpha-amylase family glycosyl hydrolase n=1 Tax=Cellulosilyticum ruminicola TaxID=425254 RepID=UPI0006CFD831|nr:alpha-amylase family glycosyl hydrolase [Cellulosilyticum ruminicola]
MAFLTAPCLIFLNYNNPRVREEIKEAATKWLSLCVDGFRLDAAIHVYSDHEFNKQNNQEAHNIQCWNEFATACEGINPTVYLIGETWDDDNAFPNYVHPFYH